MGVIAENHREIKLFYNSETSIGKQTLAYVEASNKKILAIDISKTKITGTQWAEIADRLNMQISDLIDQDHPNFVKKYGSHPLNMEQHDWLKLLEKNPVILACPIVFDGERYLQIKNPSDFAHFLESDSAGLEKPYNP